MLAERSPAGVAAATNKWTVSSSLTVPSDATASAVSGGEEAVAMASCTDAEVLAGKNPIMRINEIAMTHGLCCEWSMVSEQVR